MSEMWYYVPRIGIYLPKNPARSSLCTAETKCISHNKFPMKEGKTRFEKGNFLQFSQTQPQHCDHAKTSSDDQGLLPMLFEL